MKKLTSKSTYFNKRIFPILWFGFLGVFILTSLNNTSNGGRLDIVFMIFPLFMAVFGYFIMKKLVFDLADEVYDEGEALLIKNKGKEVRIYLKDIKNVSYATMINPPRVTMSIRYHTELGDELSFSPPASWIPFRKNKDIEELIDRIDKTRG